MQNISSLQMLKMQPAELAEFDELTARDKMFAAAIQQLVTIKNKIPSVEEIHEFTTLPVEDIKESFEKPAFRALCVQMGIPLFADIDAPSPKILSILQIQVANAILNHMDKRTLRTKLNEFGIKPTTFKGWMANNEAFRNYINKRAGDDLTHIDYLSNVKLTELVEEGDLAAIKLTKELNGQLTNKVQIDVNVNLLLAKLVDIVAVHVSNPEEREAIANAVEALAVEFGPKGLPSGSS